jgi:hypothetical protein
VSVSHNWTLAVEGNDVVAPFGVLVRGHGNVNDNCVRLVLVAGSSIINRLPHKLF